MNTSSEFYEFFVMLPRQQRDDGGVESPLTNRWKVRIKRVKTKVMQWQA